LNAGEKLKPGELFNYGGSLITYVGFFSGLSFSGYFINYIVSDKNNSDITNLSQKSEILENYCSCPFIDDL
jgi:hypothetical protein